MTEKDIAQPDAQAIDPQEGPKTKQRPGKLLDKLIIGGLGLILLFLPLVFYPELQPQYMAPKAYFFWALTDILLVLWLYGVFIKGEYQIRLSYIGGAFLLFLLAFTLSGVLGVDPNNSWWGPRNRLTGLLHWYHVFAFFLICSSVLTSKKRWRRVLQCLAVGGVLTAVFFFLGSDGLGWHPLSHEGGGTFGNTSHAGTYMLFPMFALVYLSATARSWRYRLIYAGSLLFILLSPLFFNFAVFSGQGGGPLDWIGPARAATVSFYVGIILIALLWLALRGSRKLTRRVGQGLLTLSLVGGLLAVIFLFVPGSLVQDQFVAQKGEARLVFWDMAYESIEDNPTLGIGPENYINSFYTYFDPAVYETEGNMRVDKPHNMLIEILTTGGIISFIPYILLLLLPIILVWHFYRQGRHKDFWAASVITGALVAYYLQNLTVFDTVPSLVGLAFFFALAEYLSSQKAWSIDYEMSSTERFWGATGLAALGVVAVLWTSVFPAMKNHRLHTYVVDLNTPERLEAYEGGKILGLSKASKVQSLNALTDSFTSSVEVMIQEGVGDNTGLILEEARTLLIAQEQNIKRYPGRLEHYLHFLRLANFYYLLEQDPQKRHSLLETTLGYVEDLEERQIQHPVFYRHMAQNYLLAGEFDKALSAVETALAVDPDSRPIQQMHQAIQQAIASQQPAN